MALPLAFLLALVVLSCKNTCSLGCELPQIHNLSLETPEKNEEGALILLQKMRRIPTFSCMNYRKDFAFPQKLLEGEQVQKAQAVAVLHQMTQQIFNLLSTQEAFAAWDKTLLDTFLTGLHQQLDDLKACGSKQAQVEEASLRAVRKYFHRITVYLKEKKYLPCAWEVVRAEIMKSFSSSADLYGRLRSME
ncbi:interferon alpha-5 [Ictidomys tridecemlineatus]|uniref:interferon alpha-5-like n=1 Tax=Ictidomys tridecemlineatus TaxID=43179 RepID=UPI00025DE57D|nr:interferon alpha-5-like [Ictidomys tridecemlineatus]KAG3287323.1 interferon alpha-5-like [Ictidomys tridecemlineatus]